MTVSIQLCACTYFAQWTYLTNIEATLEPLRRRETQAQEVDKSMGYVQSTKQLVHLLFHEKGVPSSPQLRGAH